MSEPDHPVGGRAPKKQTMTIEQLQEASDAALVVSIARYHEDALAEVYRRHAGAVFALARRLLADRTLAEDVLADAFERVLRSRRRFDPRRGSEKTWLYTIALNVLRDHARRRAAEGRALERSGGSIVDRTAVAEDAIRTRVHELTGYEVRQVFVHITGVHVRQEPRVR